MSFHFRNIGLSYFNSSYYSSSLFQQICCCSDIVFGRKPTSTNDISVYFPYHSVIQKSYRQSYIFKKFSNCILTSLIMTVPFFWLWHQYLDHPYVSFRKDTLSLPQLSPGSKWKLLSLKHWNYSLYIISIIATFDEPHWRFLHIETKNKTRGKWRLFSSYTKIW